MVAAGALAGPGEELSLRVLDPDFRGRILVEIGYPQPPASEGEGELTLLVDGRPALWEEVGGGFGEGMRTRSVAVTAGAPGGKVVVARLRLGSRTLEGKLTVAFAPRPALLPAWVDGELITRPVPLRADLRFVEDPSFRVNGVPVECKFEKNLNPDGVTRTAVVVEPPLSPGVNTIEILARGYDGREVHVGSRLYLAPEGRVRLGDSFRLVYGRLGSKSGPFYSVTLEGQALVETADSQDSEGRLIKSYRAAATGEARLQIFVKPHFLQPPRLKRELRLSVVEEGP
ncbi:MAG TPA: hypothetical protein VNO81_00845 [Candidatus Nitrosotenuis sp.]|nr:hypothetical protein [Candidatus Nitrosotenuis sp.]